MRACVRACVRAGIDKGEGDQVDVSLFPGPRCDVADAKVSYSSACVHVCAHCIGCMRLNTAKMCPDKSLYVLTCPYTCPYMSLYVLTYIYAFICPYVCAERAIGTLRGANVEGNRLSARP